MIVITPQKPRNSRTIRQLLIGIAVVFWVGSFFFPEIATCGFVVVNGTKVLALDWFDNLSVIFLGWLGVFAFQFGWFANITGIVLVFLVIVDKGIPKPVLALQITFLAWAFLPFSLPHFEDSPKPMCLSSYGFGAYLWAASQAIILFVAIKSLVQEDEGVPRCRV